MNAAALWSNIRHSGRICASLRDRAKYLHWIYSRRTIRKHRYALRFQYPAPVGSIEVCVRTNRGADHFIFSEIFDERVYEFGAPASAKTILDLGGNIGLASVYLGRKFPAAQIAVVEPIPANVELLRTNLQRNGIRAVVFPAAVAVANGILEMTLGSNDYGHKVAHLPYGRRISGGQIAVDAISVPSLLARLQWQRIDLVKIDIEGYEAILLQQRCDWLSSVGTIYIECHEGYGESDLTALAERYGFSTPICRSGVWLLSRGQFEARSE